MSTITTTILRTSNDLLFVGNWDALNNDPPIPPADPSNNGYYYKVTSGCDSDHGYEHVPAENFDISDILLSNGTEWVKAIGGASIQQSSDSLSAISAINTSLHRASIRVDGVELSTDNDLLKKKLRGMNLEYAGIDTLIAALLEKVCTLEQKVERLEFGKTAEDEAKSINPI